MSVKVMSLVFEHYHGQGGERCLALALADCANDSGASIWPGIERMARYSKQSERSVQRQLRAMEASGWLQCTQPSAGGKGRTNQYRINPGWIFDPINWKPNGDKMSPLQEAEPRHSCVTVSPPQTVTSATPNGDIAVSPKQLQNLKTFPPIVPQNPASQGCAVPSDLTAKEADFERAARWMLDRIRRLNPEHREPNWRRWQREIRLLTDRDGHSLREVCELFAWANADAFWQSNILSPGKLRKQWDALTIRRKANGGTAGGGEAADYRCTRCADGKRGKRAVPGIGWLCAAHLDALEREQIHA